jgi:predicted metal-dependent HD superfamily phosphohydrolase
MGVQDAHQWLGTSWLRSCRGAGATAPDDEVRAVGQRLLDRWSHPSRSFHNVRHLMDVLGRVDELSQETHDSDSVRLAAWYHGAVFAHDTDAEHATLGSADEDASALLAFDELSGLGVPEKTASRVRDLVTMLHRHFPEPGDGDAAVLSDADLALLASEPQRYKEYLRAVREEYSAIPQVAFLQARRAIVSRFLARPAIYGSPMGHAWEEAARQNLQAEQARIDKELTRIAAERPADPAA